MLAGPEDEDVSLNFGTGSRAATATTLPVVEEARVVGGKRKGKKRQRDALLDDSAAQNQPPKQPQKMKPFLPGKFDACNDEARTRRMARASRAPRQRPVAPPEQRAPISTLAVCERLRDVLQNGLGLSTLTPIQSEAIPQILDGRDALVKSQTGSGKTLAFLIPLVEKLVTQEKRLERKDGCRAIVLLPTRELCVQVLDVLGAVVKSFHWVVVGSLMGGEKKKSEKARLRKGVIVVVATPGRLVDHLRHTECFNCSGLQWLVLDEADRLLDLGFEADIQFVVEKLRAATANNAARFQTVLASATLTEAVMRLAHVSLENPSRAGFTSNRGGNNCASMEEEKSDDGEEEQSVPTGLTQSFVVVDSRNRLSMLAAVLRAHAVVERKKLIVFLSTCDSVDFHHELFSSLVLPPDLGGDKTQQPGLAGLVALAMQGDAAIASSKGITKGQRRKQERLFKRNKGKKKKRDKEEQSQQRDKEEQSQQLLLCDRSAIYKLHGNMQQALRTAAINGFRAAAFGVLFCTDVAARGLDIPNTDWIVQHDPPQEPADYIHRIGRTARAGRAGNALLILQKQEEAYLDLLERKGMELQELYPGRLFLQGFPNQQNYPSSQRINPKSGGQPGGEPRRIEIALQKAMEAHVEAHTNLQSMGCSAWQGFLRAYQTHSKDTRQIFQVKQLHLGHLATSFALKDKPSKVAERARERDRGGKNEMGQREKVGKKEKNFKKILAAARDRVRATGGGAVADGVLQGFTGKSTGGSSGKGLVKEEKAKQRRKLPSQKPSTATFEFGA